ncbi:MAG TPA: ABC transporter ATP-binding protein [Herbaspirillum sp.]|jgi:putative ABC transport system ATP-binding protein
MIFLEAIHKTYKNGDEDISVLRGISLNIKAGEFCAITGTSGSGKTTLLNLIGSLDSPTSGSYLYQGVDLGSISSDQLAEIRNRQFGFIFQSFHLLPRLSALDNVALPLFYQAVSKKQGQSLAFAQLKRVGLEHRAYHRPDQLSGGQRQRVAIARALVTRPSVILADEPTGNLDSVTAQEIFDLLCDLNEELGITVVIVTHDKSISEQCARQILIQDGRVKKDEVASKI